MATKNYVDKNGLTYFWGKVKNAIVQNSAPLVVGTQTANTGAWTGSAPDIDALEDGQQIAYWLPYAGSGNATLTLTLSDGSTTSAIPVYLKGTGRLSTQYAAGSLIRMTYRQNAVISGTSQGEGWWADADANDDTYNRLQHNTPVLAAEAVSSYRIIVGTSAGYKQIASGVSFDISYPILYSQNSIAKSKTSGSIYEAIGYISLRYNTGLSSFSGTAYSTAYLVGTLTGSTFTITDPVVTDVVPTAADNKVYIPLGVLYSAYQIYFSPINTLFSYHDGAFQPISTGSGGGGTTTNSKLYYGTCDTAASTAAKVVTCSGFVLETGAHISVKFTYSSNKSNPTLNVNGTGAVSIRNLLSVTNARYFWQDGEVVDFVYDGTYYLLVRSGTASTTWYGLTKLSNDVTSTSTALAATANSVKTAYDAATAAQTTADNASSAASAAQTTANSASSAATAAQTTANSKAAVTLSTTDIGEGATLAANTLYGVYE